MTRVNISLGLAFIGAFTIVLAIPAPYKVMAMGCLFFVLSLLTFPDFRVTPADVRSQAREGTLFGVPWGERRVSFIYMVASVALFLLDKFR